MVMYSMAKYRKTRNLKRDLGKLDQPEKDYMENLANSLLQIQNAALPQESEGQRSKKTPSSDKKKD